MPTNHGLMDRHLAGNGITFTLSGATATLTGTLTQRQFEELERVAFVTGYELQVVAGVPKLVPR